MTLGCNMMGYGSGAYSSGWGFIGMGLAGVIILSLAFFLFSLIFWETYHFVIQQNKKKKKRR